MREATLSRAFALVGVVPLAVLLSSGCGSDAGLNDGGLNSVTESSPGAAERPVGESVPSEQVADVAAAGSRNASNALELGESLGSRFNFKPTDLPLRAHGLTAVDWFAREVPRGPRAVIPKVHAVKLTASDVGITPQWSDSSAAKLVLPASAEQGFTVEEPSSNLSLRATLQGSRQSRADVRTGAVVYEGAAPAGGRVTHRVTPLGTEDYVEIDARPEAPELTYTLDLSDGVAGLRLVANVLELLDAKGTPRLRVTAPMVVDASGASFPTILAVEGCQVDVDQVRRGIEHQRRRGRRRVHSR